ncbi:MAG: peptide chain release factor N(5)-glutamine methyltransferase [Hyphomonadaceae bacterium]
MTALVELWSEVRKRLEAAGVETPVFDARLLVEAGAGVSRLDIVTDPRRDMSEAQIEAVRALAARREAREPVAHIVGLRHFWKHAFRVSPDVLIPRPETEFLVETALEAIGFGDSVRVLDLGVGSGAILLSILADRPLANGIGVDVSAAALSVAQRNADEIGVSDRVQLIEGAWSEGKGIFDVIVSNPPYIPTDEIDALAPEVVRYEPRLALDGGADGLSAYRAIAPLAKPRLTPGGLLAFEAGSGQAQAIVDLMRDAGLENVQTKLDLAGVERVVYGRAPGG